MELWTSSTPSAGSSRVLWSLLNQSPCALWTWRRYSTIKLWASCAGFSEVWGVQAPGTGCTLPVWPLSEPGSKSDSFSVKVGPCQGCPLSPILFLTFMERISMRWESASSKLSAFSGREGDPAPSGIPRFWGLVREWEENWTGDRQLYCCGGCSNVDSAPICHGEERNEPKGEALDLPVGLCTSQSSNFEQCQKNKTVGTSCQNEFPL